MVGPNKILTVSYGTFSCTLEGFDDPFSTMRGIAEYFRDLAADDRYFGAEPPTPDAEMLQRIAEKEIQRRVEAHSGPGGLILRQTDDEAEADEPVAHDAVTRPVSRQIEDAEASDEGGAPRPFVEAKTGSGRPSDRVQSETVAEKLARIRAVVNQKTDAYEEAEGASAPDDLAFEAAEADESASDEDIADEPEDADLHQVEATDASDTSGEAEVLANDDRPAELDPEAEAEDAELHATDAEAEDQSDETAPEVAFDAPADMWNDDAQDDVEAAAEEAASDDLEADVWNVMAAAEADADADAPEDLAEEVEVEDESADDQVGTEGSEILAVFADEDFDDENYDVAEQDNALSGASDFEQLVEQEIAAAEADESATDTDEADADETVSRLLKMRLNDFQAAVRSHDDLMVGYADQDVDVASEFSDENGDDTEADLARETAADISSLSEEDEQDLMASLARVVEEDAGQDSPEVEFDAADSAEDVAADADEMVEEDVQPEEVSVQADAETQDDHDEPADQAAAAIAANPRPVSRPEGVKVSRLLEVTNHELAESGNSRRRSAIAHLKAAVAATRAERAAINTDDRDGAPFDRDEDEDISAYRDDLARVVRPRRPDERVRSAPRRLPPLVLVSEQRVDLDVIKSDGPMQLAQDSMIRPRRIRSDVTEYDEDDDDAGDNIFSENGSFSEFAREMGATELPDLLEAAAAYYHYVEGQPHFSRPQIMNAVAAMNDAGEFSREEGLRSFGILLRRGTIRKVRRGQFEIAEETRFRPELRAGE